MFRTLIYPSSGACDYSAELPHWSYVVLGFRCGWVGVVSVSQAEAVLQPAGGRRSGAGQEDMRPG